MKKQLTQLRRFFSKTGARKLNAATAREVIPASYDDDDSNRLSGAFIVVLLLHVIALVGVFAFSRMKDPKDGTRDPLADRAAKTTPKPAPPSAGNATAAVAPALPDPTPSLVERPAVADIPAADPAPSGRTHLVKSGETLTRIAIAHNVRPSDLREANNLKGDDIKAGQELSIPEAKTVSAPPKTTPKPVEKPQRGPGTYTVKKNDTITRISRLLGVGADELAKLNNIKDPRRLREGQVLKVPRG